MGGANGLTPGDVMRLTPEEVRAWWLAPIEATAKAMDRERLGVTPSAPVVSNARLMSLDEFRAAFGGLYPEQPGEWWEEKYREWTEEQNAAATATTTAATTGP